MDTPSNPLSDIPGVEWRRSINETIVTRYLAQEPDTTVKHTAYFDVAPGAVPDVLSAYTRTNEQHFAVDFVVAEWRDGRLSQVTVSGATSGKVQRHRKYRGWGFREPLTFDKLPEGIAAPLQAYETAVAVAAAVARP